MTKVSLKDLAFVSRHKVACPITQSQVELCQGACPSSQVFTWFSFSKMQVGEPSPTARFHGYTVTLDVIGKQHLHVECKISATNVHF